MAFAAELRLAAFAALRPLALSGMLFDLGGTLLRLDGFDVEAGTERVLSFAENPRGVAAREVCRLVEELEVDLRVRREASLLEISPFMVHRLVYEPLEISFSKPFEEIEIEFWQAATRFTATDGIEELLASLQADSLPLGVVSTRRLRPEPSNGSSRARGFSPSSAS